MNHYVFQTLLMALLSITAFIFSGCCQLTGNCDDENFDPVVETFSESFQPDPILRLCPDHTGGDKEFAGNGPYVEMSAALIVRDSKEVFVEIYFHLKETKSNWTEAEGRWQYLLWTAPSNAKIVQIDVGGRSEASYTDVGHELDRPSVRGASLVKKFESKGDTGGDDVGNCTSDDAYLNVYFNKIGVTLEKT